MYADLALRIMVAHETIDLNGLGEAISSTVDIAQYLVHEGAAKITSKLENQFEFCYALSTH